MILYIEDDLCELDEEAKLLMQRCADAAQKTDGVAVKTAVFIEIVSDDAIQAINRDQRGKDFLHHRFLLFMTGYTEVFYPIVRQKAIRLT